MSDILRLMASTKPLITMVMDPELLERIDDFRYGMRMPTRAAAIRWLLVSALDQNPLAEPDLERYGSREPRPEDPKTPIFDPPPKRRRKS